MHGFLLFDMSHDNKVNQVRNLCCAMLAGVGIVAVPINMEVFTTFASAFPNDKSQL